MTLDDDQERGPIELLARLRRVNKQLSLWDELDTQQLLPASQRAWVDVPMLDREQLKDLQLMLIDVLRELSN